MSPEALPLGYTIARPGKSMSICCKALIFDLDGVLVDSTPVVEKHWRRWAATHALDARTVILAAHGRRTVDTIRTVAPELDAIEEAERLAREEAPDTEGLRVYAGADQLLESLPHRRWAVATSGTKLTAMTRLTFAQLPVPPVIVTADDVQDGKPNPEAYLLAASRLGVAPAHCIVVEDSPAGIMAAKRAGMRVVAVMTTHPANELAGASFVVPEIGSLSLSQCEEEICVGAVSG